MSYAGFRCTAFNKSPSAASICICLAAQWRRVWTNMNFNPRQPRRGGARMRGSCTVLISTLPVLPSCCGGGPRYLRMHQILWKYLHSSWENICSAETDLLGNLMALRSHCRWTHGDNATILTSVCVHVQCSPSKKLFLTFISNKSSRTIECNFLCFNCLLFPFEIIVRTLDTYLGFNFLLRPDDYLEAFPKEPR